MNFIYEIGLAGRVIMVRPEVWEKIMNYVRSNKWFVVIYMGKRYKYVSDKTFWDRPTRFDFEISTEEDEVIEVIYL